MLRCTNHFFKRPLCRFSKLQHNNRTAPNTLSNFSIKQQIITKIKVRGPITFAEYMKDVLLNPQGGYYMHRDVFGDKGDFITSPELSQMFGELLAVWFINEWSKAGSPKPLQIVELGPGRGTLCYDMLRVMSRFNLLDKTSVHLVEVSPHLTKLQADLLCSNGAASFGVPISWHKHLKDVPDQFAFYLAHEFFDALPIHQFKKTEHGYREILIDVDPVQESKLRFVLSPTETAVGKFFLSTDESREFVEVCPEGLTLAEGLAKRIESYGGLGLIVDYGHEGQGRDTFRAFKNHKLHDPLIEPGTADLTADVDFEAMKKVMCGTNEVLVYGPVSQRTFLMNMGIECRLENLRKNAKPEQIESLDYSYGMLVDPDKMGDRFKFLAVVPSTLSVILNKYPICGFS
ncbi:hypothetical protein RI129_012528 [Pyrocoelia pectoralis]|uniref:Protein arginine methyltransferase NDUFAF7 n=1 Tax=Pyrocoelia pectoralis TaxID=417401 RepID=A0AAN7UZI6_9COLE